MSTILVVEDEAAIAELISINLRHAGFDVTIAGDAAQAQVAIDGAMPSLVVLDWMLPGTSGQALARQWRAHPRTRELPIIMLTARAEEADKISGLEAGADDYLTKPFSTKELLARIRTLLRRGALQSDQIFRLADLEVDPVRRRVSRSGERIELTAKEYALLDYFVRHVGEVASRTLIAEHVWDMHFDSDTNVVDVAVRRLRAKIDDPYPGKLIHTLRGVGYVFDSRAD